MLVRSPQRLTSNIHVDILDMAASTGHKNHIHGALVSIDLTCPADFFYGRRDLVVKFSLSFTTQIQDGFHNSVEIQHAEVDYFRADNDMERLVDGSKPLAPEIRLFQDGKADIEIPWFTHNNNYSKNLRIVVLLDVYPSNMDVFASLSTLSATGGSSQLSSAFNSVTLPYMALSPNDERLQRLLSWTAGLSYEKFFAAYLDNGPSILDMEDKFGMTPFSCAALAWDDSVIRQALEQGGSISARARTARGPSPLEVAARRKDSHIFDAFLIFLKYFDGPGSESLGDKQTPRLMDMPALKAEDIERELKIAAFGEQTATIRRLIEMLLDCQDDKESWLASQLVQAARMGTLCLVQILQSCGANLMPESDGEVDKDIDDDIEENMTPLMSAITHGKTNIAEFLISHGAGSRSALRVAVKERQHSTIRALLQAGIPMDEDFAQDLLEIATKKRDSTTLMLLKLEKGAGKLANSRSLNREVDKLFMATVVDFSEARDAKFSELTVDELMQRPGTYFSVSGQTKFKWFHLPANNMKWVEALIGKIYHDDPSLAYKVLEPKLWVKRQHEGESGSPYARFMMPACHDFSGAFKDKKKLGNAKKDKHVVLFMPFLHWDEEETMKRRSEFITPYPKDRVGTEIISPSKEEKLLRTYLLSGDDDDPRARHVLHIRRTLNQSLYHNLEDTISLDTDRTVHRYQKKSNKEKPVQKQKPLAVIMVDQLWLWVLVGPSGKAEAIVTCFPSRDWSDVGIEMPKNAQTNRILDPRRTTDVLQMTKSYIQQRPNAVKTPYNLLGVIASRCSRALMDHSTDMLNFAEVYENSISEIMNEAALLFKTFDTVMQTRTNLIDGSDHMDDLKDKPDPKRVNSYKNLSKTIMDDIYSLKALFNDLQNNGTREMDRSKAEEPGKWNQIFKRKAFDINPERADQMDGNTQELEILKDSENICKEYRQYTLDTEIPDENEIQELGKKNGQGRIEHLIKLLAKFGRFYILDITREINLLRWLKDIQDELDIMEKIFVDQKAVLEAMDRIVQAMEQPYDSPNDDIQAGKLNGKLSLPTVYNGNKTKRDFHEELIYDVSNNYNNFEDVHTQDYVTETQKGNMSTGNSIIWGLGSRKMNLPLRTVHRHSNQIQKLIQRAKDPELRGQLNSLIDLKQKQSNIIDARAARIQAEQSHKMAAASEKLGKTLMVFTVVTIIFLPLSFIAAFLAIPTKEFGTGTLTLDFVSKITFSASAAISVFFIVIGFAAADWRFTWLKYVISKIDRQKGSPSRESNRNIYDEEKGMRKTSC